MIYFIHEMEDGAWKESNPVLRLVGEGEELLLFEGEEVPVSAKATTYESFEGTGHLAEGAFLVLNNIPVLPEGREIFEARFQKRAGQIEDQPGFRALRVLRPQEGNTYVVMSLWQDEASFQAWTESKAFAQAHQRPRAEQAAERRPVIFAGESYVTTYVVK